MVAYVYMMIVCCVACQSDIVVLLLLILCFPRPYLWGAGAAHTYQQKEKVGWLLWKQPGMREVLELLDRKRLFQSSNDFPVALQLEVSSMDWMYDEEFVISTELG